MKIQFTSLTRTILVAGSVVFASAAYAQESSPAAKTAASPNMSAMPTTAKSGENANGGAMNKQGMKAGAMGQLDAKDKQFMMTAAKGGMMEVHMGEMAQKMGQSADVKKIGARMVADHSKVNGELMALASSKGVKLDTRHKMDKMESANFDQMYLDQMVKDHNKDIAEFQTEAKNGMDPELKSFAAKNLPTLQSHLKMVKDAQGKMMKKS